MPRMDDGRKWWILGAMSGVLGLVVLDETVVGVALATIQADLAMTQVASHWVVNAYMLSFACLVAIGGRLGDSLGHKGLFLAGVAVFGLASLGSGSAPNGAWLIAARALQGVGAAIMFPSCWAIMTGIFPPAQRGVAFGIQTTVGGIFMSMGPLVGGFFAQEISWRWIFWINLPVTAVIAAVVLAAWVEPLEEKHASAARRSGSIDLRGLVTLVAGLTALVIALMQSADWGWGSPATLLLLCGGIVLLAVFAVFETRRREPLIELGLLRIATFTGGNLVFFMFQFGKVAVFVFVALYLQDVLHKSPIEAGIVILMAVLPTLLTSLLAGRLTDRFGARRPLLIGLLLHGSAIVLLGVAMTGQSYALVIAPLVVWGATMPFVSVCPRRALLSAVPEAKVGQASGVNLTIQMLGGTVSVALCGTLLLMTGNYWSVFLMTGVLTFLVWGLAWLTVERPATT